MDPMRSFFGIVNVLLITVFFIIRYFVTIVFSKESKERREKII